MSWDDFKSNKTEKLKDITVGGTYSHFYAIFRIAEKYKMSISQFIREILKEFEDD